MQRDLDSYGLSWIYESSIRLQQVESRRGQFKLNELLFYFVVSCGFALVSDGELEGEVSLWLVVEGYLLRAELERLHQLDINYNQTNTLKKDLIDIRASKIFIIISVINI